MAEGNLAHAQDIQTLAIQADIDDAKAGRLYGFLALMALIIAAGVSAFLGNELMASAFLGAGVLGVVGQLIKGRGSNEKED
ncbi:hypothetical protein GCM10010833_03540 [Blastomonas aquatica]|uniref:Uncharacterized protein n=2 Tax=Blastomonas aquatica TaxID=1510276 RepID=A0ABQ1IWE2_9SPHN|nr:hypothetical protein GCM10010833_03540 [Blastomonas aquatica]